MLNSIFAKGAKNIVTALLIPKLGNFIIFYINDDKYTNFIWDYILIIENFDYLKNFMSK